MQFNPFKLLFSVLLPNPNYLILFITSKCNSKCKTCFNWKARESCDLKSELNLREIWRISQNFPNLQFLTISGGEPFLHPKLKYIIEIFIQNTHVPNITIPTNGSLPNIVDEQINWILQRHPGILLNIDLSIDGIKEKHDDIRGFPGNFEMIIETFYKLDRLRHRFPNLNIRTSSVLSSYNQDDLIKTKAWLEKNLKIDMPTFALIRGHPREKKALKINNISYIRLARNFKTQICQKMHQKNALVYTLFSLLKILTWEIVANYLIHKEIIVSCKAGQKMLVIDEKANLYPCEMLAEPFGNLREKNFLIKDVLQNESAKRIMGAIKKQQCKCTFECAIQNSIVNSPKYYHWIFSTLFRNRKC